MGHWCIRVDAGHRSLLTALGMSPILNNVIRVDAEVGVLIQGKVDVKQAWRCI